ncbi:hypothetical protein BOX08_gp15 [Pseudoalteromonas phage BS5]|uniref:hypothetical protein n=1 Tax=Pseudoalteromonas phage BS5 TaxID=1874539 RepID=UPI0008199385|nr:hypothetical protein BOX08_gp15 [Pseudoalteromonas phage BS5]ANY29580.1 hypothetical protein [Pseudoalteromonas phage BS5]
MSKTKFTKGKWEVVNGIFVNSPSGDVLSACCVDMDEAVANASLISKAPKMYEMLESVASELYMLIDEVNDQRASRITPQTESGPDYHDMQTLHEIQLLLKEARGE